MSVLQGYQPEGNGTFARFSVGLTNILQSGYHDSDALSSLLLLLRYCFRR